MRAIKFYPKSHKKECTKCHEIKPFSEFHKGNDLSGLKYRCKQCDSLYKKEYYQKNKDVIKQKAFDYWKRTKHIRLNQRKDIRLRHLHNITLDEYNFMFEMQEGKCNICGTKLYKDKKTHVDHCHKTHDIRGLLCNHCNAGLGHFFDNITILKEAIKYLKKHN